MKNRTEEIRRNLEMIAPTWTLLGLALAACGGGGGGGVGSGRVSGPPPINAGAPVMENARIPDIREAPRGSPAIILTEGQNSVPNLYYRYETHTYVDGTILQSNVGEYRIADFDVDEDGEGNVPQSMFEIDGSVLTYDSPRTFYPGGAGSYTFSLRTVINDYLLHVDGLTVEDLVADDLDSDTVERADAVSLSSVWTITVNEYGPNGQFLGRSSDSTTIAGAPQSDGSIDIEVSLYEDANGSIYFSPGSGRTLLSSSMITFNPPSSESNADEPDVTFLGVREGSSYDVPVIFTNVAKDGFGNIEIVPSDGAIDSLPEVLIIDARGTTGDVHNTGHIWYHNGEVVEDATAVLFIAIETGRYHAEVGVDLDGDRIADILVETLPVDIA